ncbi:MAG TPA: NADPH-dependent FMN reductase [Candidatus Babeliales bacterium]|jgi:NAD(P)H-dependent FMN reductase|nr:NADPH-dependent FMN reductase [Candidatus Babeliales bacterium]
MFFNKSSVILGIVIVSTIVVVWCCNTSIIKEDITNMKKDIHIAIILGSTRDGRISEKIGVALKYILDKRSDIKPEIIDLKDYNLPFLYDQTPPASQTVITDPIIQKWSEKIRNTDGFIIIVPEYNAGYPGVLKNALDLLYKEWNNKPVGLVGHSGGPSGGISAITQMQTVLHAFKMIPASSSITIPTSWKAFDEKGGLIDQTIEPKLMAIINELLKHIYNKIS